ncbi:hypothetical protein [Roseovarius indicus]|jgi:hypothetical protein|uniref:hypothetical protein n=1 Tax=Roseovarius indicus TaxID=540747 RepID=UPI0032F05B76
MLKIIRNTLTGAAAALIAAGAATANPLFKPGEHMYDRVFGGYSGNSRAMMFFDELCLSNPGDIDTTRRVAREAGFEKHSDENDKLIYRLRGAMAYVAFYGEGARQPSQKPVCEFMFRDARRQDDRVFGAMEFTLFRRRAAGTYPEYQHDSSRPAYDPGYGTYVWDWMSRNGPAEVIYTPSSTSEHRFAIEMK